MLSDILLFGKAFKNTRHAMAVSMVIVLILTLILSFIFFAVESVAQPDVFCNYSSALVWTYSRYIEAGDGVFDGAPVTVIGKIVASLLGLVGIAIVAIPAGLIGSGFIDAIAEDKRSKELEEIRHRLHKKFKRSGNKALREYLDTLPDNGGDKLKILNFVPRNKALSTLHMQMGVSLQDLFDAAKTFPEFRIHNLATSKSSEENVNDRFVMELYPLNRSYGCCINRNSNVTIISTSSYDENGIGWWTYYLALFGGFNYVSKDLEVDMDDVDSFFNMSPEPSYEGKKRSRYTQKDEGYRIIIEKELRREDFFKDIHGLSSNKENNWVFAICESIKNSSNTADLHIAINNKTGDAPTVRNNEAYTKLTNEISALFSEMKMECVQNTSRFPLLKKNLLYRIKEVGKIDCNAVSLRPSSDIVAFDNRSLVIAFRLAQAISNSVSDGKGMQDDDLKELKIGYGYMRR